MDKPDIRLNTILRKAIKNDPDFLAVYFEEAAIDYMVDMVEEQSHVQEQIDMILRANPSVIYSKEFAQAFWFDDDAGITFITYFPPEEGHPDKQTLKHWQYHQVQMILADNPLDYLESFL